MRFISSTVPLPFNSKNITALTSPKLGYQTWDECKAQTVGFSGAIFKSFKTRNEAEAFMSNNTSAPPASAAAAAASYSAATAAPSSNVGLTPEQRRRIEENRKRALKIRQMKMAPSPRQQQSEVFDLSQDDDDDHDDVKMSANNKKKRARAAPPEPSSATTKRRTPANSNNLPPRYPDHDDIDYEDMEDSLQFQLDMAPIYDGSPSATDECSHSSKDETKKEEEEGDELQLKAIQLASEGKNIFLTGKAGTGKSWVTKKIVQKFRTKLDKTIHVTAPTGIAAINVGGVTINTWGNYHLGSYYEDFDRMWEKRHCKKISSADALLIDEISMLDGHTFDCLECMVAILRCYKDRYGNTNPYVKNTLKEIKAAAGTENTLSDTMLRLRWDVHRGLGNLPPFGGMQLIVVGDFYQLSPVPNGIDVLMENDNLREIDYDLKIGRQGAFAFESVAWHQLGLHTIELTNVHRQADVGLLSFLNAMREAEKDLLSKHSDTLRLLQTPIIDYGDDIVPTELHSKNYVVDKRNKEELQKLPDNVGVSWVNMV